jgi:hypothetical protein
MHSRYVMMVQLLTKGEDPDAKKDMFAEITFERDKELLSVSIT